MNTPESLATIVGNKTKTEVAQAYFPFVESSTARRNLSRWIRMNPQLECRLEESGYRARQKYFTPLQLSILYDMLGEP